MCYLDHYGDQLIVFRAHNETPISPLVGGNMHVSSSTQARRTPNVPPLRNALRRGQDPDSDRDSVVSDDIEFVGMEAAQSRAPPRLYPRISSPGLERLRNGPFGDPHTILTHYYPRDDGEPWAVEDLRREKIHAKLEGRDFSTIDQRLKDAAKAERQERQRLYMEIQRLPLDDILDFLQEGIYNLQEEYPDDIFEVIAGNKFQRIFCHECPCHDFAFGAKAINLKKHLDGPSHRDNVASRLIRESINPDAPQHPIFKALPSWMHEFVQEFYSEHLDDKILPKRDDSTRRWTVECLECIGRSGKPIFSTPNADSFAAFWTHVRSTQHKGNLSKRLAKTTPFAGTLTRAMIDAQHAGYYEDEGDE